MRSWQRSRTCPAKLRGSGEGVLAARFLLARLLPVLAALCVSAPVEAMTFKLTPFEGGRCRASCPAVISAEGEIGLATAEDFVDFVSKALRQTSVSKVVLINSPGGNVAGAVKLGWVLRKVGATVMVARPAGPGVVNGSCYSACVFAMMGGLKRVVPFESKVGVHRMYRPGVHQRDVLGSGSIDANVPDANMGEMMRWYARMMGVSQELISLSEMTPSETIHVLSRAEISRFRLARERL
jgi:hypothetical protein